MDVNFEIKTSAKAGHLRIAIHPNGRVVVTKPARVSLIRAQEFVKSKFAWINQKLLLQKSRKVIPLATFDKNQVLDFVKSRVEILNRNYKFRIGNISIKNNKSLWGSCSRRGNLNFNLRIASLSVPHADYIIVHELCHLAEFNHSQKFWALVSKTIPNHKHIRAELKSFALY